MPHTAALLQVIGVAGVLVLFAETARAQVAGDSPTTDIYWLGSGRNHSSENRWQEAESEQRYREAVKRIPERKASNDPWRTVRQAPAAADRHGAR